MTDPKPRSSFLPILLLIVGLVVCAGVGVAVFVPMVECEECSGIGKVTAKDAVLLESVTGAQPSGSPCTWCKGPGRTSLRKYVFEDPPDRLQNYVPKEAILKFIEMRKDQP